MTDESEKPSIQFAFSWPIAMLVVGVLFVGASFLPLGEMAARAQWTTADSAAYDRVSREYKQGSYESPQRHGMTQAQWDAQLSNMKQQMLALEGRLNRAKSQPQRWSHYLLGIGILLTAAGFFAASRT